MSCSPVLWRPSFGHAIETALPRSLRAALQFLVLERGTVNEEEGAWLNLHELEELNHLQIQRGPRSVLAGQAVGSEDC